jgi:hypothetical protein
VQAVARDVLNANRRTVGVLLPEPESQREIETELEPEDA